MFESQFLEKIKKNSVNAEVLNRLPELEIPDVWLVSGSLFQTVWNDLTGRPLDYGIKDYDIFYFDKSDLSWEAEDRVIKKVNQLFSDLDAQIEIRNQARVHLWYPEKFGVEYQPLLQTTDGIDRFLAKACQVGVRVSDQYVYSPSGLEDLFNMVIRPHPSDNFQIKAYNNKALRWKKIWPELTIINDSVKLEF